jgi:hypothetical protein
MARPTGYERVDAMNIRIPIEGADDGIMAEGALIQETRAIARAIGRQTVPAHARVPTNKDPRPAFVKVLQMCRANPSRSVT